jgi:murein DD-endopeptidase
VTLNLGDGRYAFYEHLQHGSIRVKPGDRVKTGHVLGLLGNSGSSSSGPHLHFHVANTSSTLAAEGLPYVFNSFEVVGGFENIDDVATGKPWDAIAPSEAGKRRLELPDANVILLFPAGRPLTQIR